MSQASARLAGALQGAGLRKGDRVLVLMPRVPMFQVAMSACLHLGIIPVPCVTQLSESELDYHARQCHARGVLTSAEFTQRCSAVAADMAFLGSRLAPRGWQDLDAIARDPADAPAFAAMPGATPALMYFTSGSSGMPKAVIHSARGVFVRCYQPWTQLDTRPGDVIWSPSDTGWTRAGSCLLFGAWSHGATALIVEATGDAAKRLDVVKQEGVTIYAGVATDLRQVMAQAARRPLPKLRWTITAGEAMTAELAQAWHDFAGTPLVVGYGQTETAISTLTDPASPARNGMIGKPLAGNHMAIVDAQGREVAHGVEGQIVLRADDPGQLLGYWVGDDIVPAARIGPWHLTGDCGYLDEEGNLYFIGRDDDVISSAGYRIGPTEVENALGLHPCVAECAVAASPDAQRGEIVKAYIVLRPSAQPGEQLVRDLQEHVKRTIAPYKYPRAIEFVADLPRTPTGKISRRLLREAAPKEPA
jgi:acyl-coenzyme A synthetase/AMP-(fatty) acid ligase